MDFDELLEAIDPTGKWGTDGFGIDSNLIHCGEMIEQDCPACCVCGAPNPLVQAGMI